MQIISAAIVTLALAGCGVKLVHHYTPVNLTQVPQLEVYTQRYTFCAENDAIKRRLVEVIFGKKLDESPDPYPYDRIIVQGYAAFRFTAVPHDIRAIVVEGHGWHKVFYGELGPQSDEEARERNRKLLGIAEYRVEDDGPWRLDALALGSLTLRTTVWSTSWYDHTAPVYQSAEVFIRVYFREFTDGVYSIDYGREHDVGVAIEQNGAGRVVRQIGYMRFATPNDGGHMLDVRDVRPDDLAPYPEGPPFEAPRRSSAPVVDWIVSKACQDT